MRRRLATSSRSRQARRTSATSSCPTKGRSATTSPSDRRRPTTCCLRRVFASLRRMRPNSRKSARRTTSPRLRTSGPTNHWKLVALRVPAEPGRVRRHHHARRQLIRRRPSSRRCRMPSSSTGCTCIGDPVLGQKRGIARSFQRHNPHQLLRVRLQGHRTGLPEALSGLQRPGQLSASRTTISRAPPRTCCSAAPIREFRTWSRRTSRSAETI